MSPSLLCSQPVANLVWTAYTQILLKQKKAFTLKKKQKQKTKNNKKNPTELEHQHDFEGGSAISLPQND